MSPGVKVDASRDRAIHSRIVGSAIAAVAIAVTAAAAIATTSEVHRPAAPRHFDTNKMRKEDVAIQRRQASAGKSKLCCGYPLAGVEEWALRFYWMAREEDYDDPEEIEYQNPDEVELYTPRGFYLGAVPDRFAWALRMEGSGLMSDGRVINYAGPCGFGYGTCFEELDLSRHPFGRGSKRRSLVPFKSVAIDLTVVPIGEPLYIPEFDGMALPDGSIHDGCVRADDTGGGIKKQKMDFFVVTYGNFRFLLSELWGLSVITPHIEAPRCEYLR
jgi:3D (Asp-Asp-Asp) domain-containing protein